MAATLYLKNHSIVCFCRISLMNEASIFKAQAYYYQGSLQSTWHPQSVSYTVYIEVSIDFCEHSVWLHPWMLLVAHLAMPIGQHTSGDEQSRFAMMDVTEHLSDCGAFLAETFILVNIYPWTFLNKLHILKARNRWEARGWGWMWDDVKHV